MSQSLPANLPDISTAKLPVVYESAVNALSECSRIDECQSWANKAEALASYARQARDEQLRKMADRIQARAIRRCGELLKQVEPSKGGRPSKTKDGADPSYYQCPNCYDYFDAEVWHCRVCAHHWPMSREECWNCHETERDDSPVAEQIPEEEVPQHLRIPITRTQIATEAGLSERQRKTALRVANIPEADFNSAVESESPPTVTNLAEQGKKARPLVDLEGIDPRDYARATELQGTLKRFAEYCEANSPERIAKAFKSHEVAKLRGYVSTVDHWLDLLIATLPED